MFSFLLLTVVAVFDAVILLPLLLVLWLLQINHLADGMKVGLSDKVEKHSEKLGRDAIFTLNSKIKRLPRYLCIQVCRSLAVATLCATAVAAAADAVGACTNVRWNPKV